MTEHLIDSYAVYAITGTHRTCIQFFERDIARGSVCFYPDDASLADARLESDGTIHLNMRVNRLYPVLDIVRNERPLYIFYKSPEMAGIRTGRKVIGDDSMWIT